MPNSGVVEIKSLIRILLLFALALTWVAITLLLTNKCSGRIRLLFWGCIRAVTAVVQRMRWRANDSRLLSYIEAGQVLLIKVAPPLVVLKLQIGLDYWKLKVGQNTLLPYYKLSLQTLWQVFAHTPHYTHNSLPKMQSIWKLEDLFTSLKK